MKLLIQIAAAASLTALAACSGDADDQAAENIEAMTENRAETLEAAADNAANPVVEEQLEERADSVEEMGDEAAERADDNDNALVEGQVANQLGNQM